MKNQSKNSEKLIEALEFWLIELPVILIAIIGLLVFILCRDAEAKMLAERSMAYTGLPLIIISYMIDLIRSIRRKSVSRGISKCNSRLN